MDQAELEKRSRGRSPTRASTLRGVHVYTATQVFEVEPLLEHCRNIFEIALEAADHAGRRMEMIDFGGGFGVPYFEKRRSSTSTPSARASGSCSTATAPTRASRGAASSSSSGATSWPTPASTSRGSST